MDLLIHVARFIKYFCCRNDRQVANSVIDQMLAGLKQLIQIKDDKVLSLSLLLFLLFFLSLISLFFEDKVCCALAFLTGIEDDPRAAEFIVTTSMLPRIIELVSTERDDKY